MPGFRSTPVVDQRQPRRSPPHRKNYVGAALDPRDDKTPEPQVCFAVLRDGWTLLNDPMPVRVNQWPTLAEAAMACRIAAAIWGRAWIEHWYMGTERDQARRAHASCQHSDVIVGYVADGDEVREDPLAGPTDEQLA